MKTRTLYILMFLATASMNTAFAGTAPEPLLVAVVDPAPAGGPDDGAMTPEKREETRKKIEALRIWRLTEALKLDPATSAKLAAILSNLDQQKLRIQREQHETMRALRQMLKDVKPDEAKLKSLLDTLEKNHRAMQELRNRELNDLKNALTVEQQARFLLFQQEFMRELRGLVDDARGMGMGPGRGMGGGRMRGPGRPPED